MELVAPGQQIVSTGAFGGVCVVGGTSLAAPHVTAVASVLWQKDRSVSADFIRSLLAFTANQYGEDYEYGNGLVDLEFALSQFDAFREVYAVDADVLNEQVGAAVEVGTLDVNEKPVEEFEGVVYVEGSWAPDQHNKFPELNGISGILTGDKLALVKLGAIAPDSILPAMKRHSEWHGYIRHVANGEDILWYSNYVFTYIFVSEIAKGVAEGKSPTSVNNSLSVKCIDNSTCPKGDFCGAAMLMEIREQFCNGGIITEDDFGNLTGQKSWSELFNNKYLLSLSLCEL